MKTFLLLVTALALGGASLPAQTLLLDYNFNNATSGSGGVPDSSGNNHNATVNYNSSGNATVGAPGSGVSGQAGDRSFNNSAATMGGTGGNLYYTGPGFGKQMSFTLTLWFKTDGSQSMTAGTRLLQMDGSPDRLYVAVPGTGAGNLTVNQLGATGTGSLAATTTANSLISAQNTWEFLAITYDGTKATNNFTIYIGNATTPLTALVTTAAVTKTGAWDFGSEASTVSLFLGGYYSSTSSAYQGSLDGYLDNIRLFGDANGAAGALSEAALNAIRLADASNSAIPEPSAYAIIAGGAMLGLVLLRKRRR